MLHQEQNTHFVVLTKSYSLSESQFYNKNCERKKYSLKGLVFQFEPKLKFDTKTTWERKWSGGKSSKGFQI